MGVRWSLEALKATGLGMAIASVRQEAKLRVRAAMEKHDAAVKAGRGDAAVDPGKDPETSAWVRVALLSREVKEEAHEAVASRVGTRAKGGGGAGFDTNRYLDDLAARHRDDGGGTAAAAAPAAAAAAAAKLPAKGVKRARDDGDEG